MNEVIQTIKNHRSYRKYKADEIDDVKLQTILQAAQSAPSWINGQQVSIIVVKDINRKKHLAELCGNQKYVAEAPVFLVFCMDFYRASVASEMENKSFEAVEHVDSLLVGATDVGLALANSITAAESFGLATVPIGGIRRNGLEVIDFLQLPKYVVPISGLCVGYPDEETSVKPRLPFKSVVHEETYNAEQQEHLTAYNKTFNTYLEERGDTATDWTKRVAQFYDNMYYKNIDKMLKQQGFVSKDM